MRLPFDHFDLIACWYDRLITRPTDDPLPDLLAIEAGQWVLDAVLAARWLCVPSRCLPEAGAWRTLHRAPRTGHRLYCFMMTGRYRV